LNTVAHDPLQCIKQLRQTLAADKLSVGFFVGAGCPCAVRVPGKENGESIPLIPDIRGLTDKVHRELGASPKHAAPYNTLLGILNEDGEATPTIEAMLNRIRSLRDVAGKAVVRGLSFAELDLLDHAICQAIKHTVACDLPGRETPYHALARFIGTRRNPLSDLFTTNYDLLLEQALENSRVPYFDGFVGSSRPFFDQRAIEEDRLPVRWCRLSKLHGSINWRFNKTSKSVSRSAEDRDGDELLIHPSHRKYDESRRMPYLVMFDRLRFFLRNSQKPVALFIVGYSFSDEHLNDVLVENLKANPSAACFALQYDKLAAYPIAERLAADNVNLSVLAKDAAVIRRIKAPWVAQPATDFSSIDGAFFRSNPKDQDDGNSNHAEKPYDCEFILGEFGRLGKFLDQFSGQGISDVLESKE